MTRTVIVATIFTAMWIYSVCAQENEPPMDVRAFLQKNHVLSLFHDWIARGRPRPVWGAPGADEQSDMNDVAWKEVQRGTRAVRRVDTKELAELVEAVCLVMRTAIETDDIAIRCRGADEFTRLCNEIHRRVVAYPDHHKSVPLNQMTVVVMIETLAAYEEHVKQLEHRMADERKRAEEVAILRAGPISTSAPSSMPDLDREVKIVDATTRNVTSDEGLPLAILARSRVTTIESLFARCAIAMGMAQNETLDNVAIRLRSETPLRSGGHDEAILLSKLVVARASLVSLATTIEICRDAGEAPNTREDYLAKAKAVKSSVVKHSTAYPPEYMTPARLWRFAQESIALTQKELRSPRGEIVMPEGVGPNER